MIFEIEKFAFVSFYNRINKIEAKFLKLKSAAFSLDKKLSYKKS